MTLTWDEISANAVVFSKRWEDARSERSEAQKLLMVSDFETILVYDRERTGKPARFKTKDLRKNIRRFSVLAGYGPKRDLIEQSDVNVKAAEKMAKLHDALERYGYEGHELKVYLVRLLFCLFAEDTEIFPRQSFRDYVNNSKESELPLRLGKLFEVLNMPNETRAKRSLLTSDELQFQYVNGGLFQEKLPTADFDATMRRVLLDCCDFDWSAISPAIFGAMFQGVMDKKKRRELGVHYTSRENILKVINPLFLNDLWAELNRAKSSDTELDEFHKKIAQLKFLDPACGCGNFLMVAYQELRMLEFELLKLKMSSRQKVLDVSILSKVNVEQFYGIEYEDFPCEIARVGMWLVDHQMNRLVSSHFGRHFARLPLTKGATIVHDNALKIDWESVVPKEELSFIFGNPPFLGYSNQSKAQKVDILSVYLDSKGKPFKTAGKIDYVAAWYYRTAQYLVGTQIRAAFVSTNSITQGEQAASVWKPLFEMFGIQINFAYRTFKWSNEAKDKANVHCVIVGFSTDAAGKRIIFDGEEQIEAKNICPYIVDAPNIFVESRGKPLCNVPEMITGNRPADGGHLIIEDTDLANFIKADPLSKKYIRPFMGSDEFIKNKKRWCLWLVDVPAEELLRMPEVRKRIAACKKDRENSPDEGRRQLAKTPMLFREQISPKVDYIIIPATSSEQRQYIPIGFVEKNTIVSNAVLVIPDVTLYHFGILTSSVHMAWMRAVCGRLEMRYRYSKDIVYNNFPWPESTDAQQAEIATAAQVILDIRAAHPTMSLAKLYDDVLMAATGLLAAHEHLDRAVMKLYGFGKDLPESKIVAALMERYQDICRIKKL